MTGSRRLQGAAGHRAMLQGYQARPDQDGANAPLARSPHRGPHQALRLRASHRAGGGAPGQAALARIRRTLATLQASEFHTPNDRFFPRNEPSPELLRILKSLEIPALRLSWTFNQPHQTRRHTPFFITTLIRWFCAHFPCASAYPPKKRA
jgi:hypothetical protein